MDTLTSHASLVGGAAQLLAFLGLAVVCLLRVSRPWAVLGLLGALAELVSTGWYVAAELAVLHTDGSFASVSFWFSTPAHVVMQLLAVVGVLLLVAAVLTGRRAPAEPAEPTEGPTGTTFRQLPSGLRWE